MHSHMEPQTASAERQDRAEDITVLDTRRISEDVWEMDCINDRGESREEMTLIPSDIYENTKDSRYRGPQGVVGKYLRALAQEDEDAREALQEAIRQRRDEVQSEIRALKREDSHLLHSQHDLGGSGE